MKRNARLLNKAADRIESIPESYSQTTFKERSADAPCGTVACLAGEIIICSERSTAKGLKTLHSTPLRDVWLKAARLAGLTDDEADVLFNTSYGWTWPTKFSERFDHAKTKKQEAKVAASLLRYLAKGGKV